MIQFHTQIDLFFKNKPTILLFTLTNITILFYKPFFITAYSISFIHLLTRKKLFFNIFLLTLTQPINNGSHGCKHNISGFSYTHPHTHTTHNTETHRSFLGKYCILVVYGKFIKIESTSSIFDFRFLSFSFSFFIV